MTGKMKSLGIVGGGGYDEVLGLLREDLEGCS